MNKNKLIEIREEIRIIRTKLEKLDTYDYENLYSMIFNLIMTIELIDKQINQ